MQQLNRSHQGLSLFMLASLAATITLSACVTTSPPPTRRGIPLGSGSSASSASNTGSTNPIAMPDGPIATPAPTGSTVASRATVSILELGSITYDGQVLPLVSPDGLFMAVESGEAPSWATILATDNQRPAQGTRLLACSLDEGAEASQPTGQARSLKPLPWDTTPGAGLPVGAILGRSSDSAGFLIEMPQPDNSRWIGKVDWISGKHSWLVQGNRLNAQAVLGPAGELAYARRDPGSRLWELVIQKPGVLEPIVMRATDVSYCYPVFSDEPGEIFAFALSSAGVELFVYQIPTTGGTRELTVLGRRQLLQHPDEAAVYQSVAGLQVPMPRSLNSGKSGGSSTGFALFHPGMGRMCVFDRRAGTMTPLLERSFAAAPVDPAANGGYLIATDKSLRYITDAPVSSETTSAKVAQASEGLTVASGALLPRLTTNAKWPYVLIGPGGNGQETSLKVMKFQIGEAK